MWHVITGIFKTNVKLLEFGVGITQQTLMNSRGAASESAQAKQNLSITSMSWLSKEEITEFSNCSVLFLSSFCMFLKFIEFLKFFKDKKHWILALTSRKKINLPSFWTCIHVVIIECLRKTQNHLRTIWPRCNMSRYT